MYRYIFFISFILNEKRKVQNHFHIIHNLLNVEFKVIASYPIHSFSNNRHSWEPKECVSALRWIVSRIHSIAVRRDNFVSSSALQKWFKQNEIPSNFGQEYTYCSSTMKITQVQAITLTCVMYNRQRLDQLTFPWGTY